MGYKELKAKYQTKVDELDKRMEEVTAKLEIVEKGSKEYDALIEECMDIMIQTNRYLRAMGASESQMYDL